MLFDLFMKFVLTPENVLGLVFQILTIVSMCLIFHAWKEKWWKSLIPFYGTYLLYQHTWKRWKWLFLVEMILSLAASGCSKLLRERMIDHVFFTIKTFIETKQLEENIDLSVLLLYITIVCISTAIIFILKRITYVKICSSLNINNILLKIGTFVLPELFLLLDYIYFKKVLQPALLEELEE